MKRFPLVTVARWSLVVLLLSLVALPATGAPKERPASHRMLTRMSTSVATRYWTANPEEAPSHLQSRFVAAHNVAAAGAGKLVAANGIGAAAENVFNFDIFGFPQNEEAVDACRNNLNYVIEGTNDYRGLLDPEGNFTGWHFSADGGASLLSEGLLPPVIVGGTDERPSGGDPVFRFSKTNCNLFGSSLNYDPFDPFGMTNGIGIYRTTPGTLMGPACGDGGFADPDCWPTRRFAAFSPDPTHFFDKEWFDVGVSGGAGNVVWVTYSDFDLDPTPPNPAGFTAEIFAVRCDAMLAGCTAPIPISVDDVDVQFSDVTIGPDGRVYVTWAQIEGELEGTPQRFIFKMRVAEPGSTVFGPEMVIFEERSPIPFGGFLHANDFRVATYPKHEVKMVGGSPRIYLTWDACGRVIFQSVCEEPKIFLMWSDDGGASWSPRKVISQFGDNYFPAISSDPTSNRLVVAWFTNRFDTMFHNRQDVEMVTLRANGTILARQRITKPSNESEADPLLGGFFIGDYIDVAVNGQTAWVGYNANYRRERLLFEGVPIPQQDNYVAVVDPTP
ncbi:MAG: hypothetical protein HY658_10795 [Actinobacteria bacterium]|nr:hypothetical protein [Actinomycetota bacterium]